MNTKTRFWITRIFLVVLAMTLFIGCQKDDQELSPETIANHEGHTHFDTVSADDIPHIIDFLKTKSNDRMQFTLNDNASPFEANRSHDENLSITTPLLDQIKQATNSYGKTNYTFS